MTFKCTVETLYQENSCNVPMWSMERTLLGLDNDQPNATQVWVNI